MTRPASATKPSGKSKQSQASAEPVVALKPRPKLFYALLVIFIVWIGFLLTLYFTTVYHRTDVHVESATRRALP